MPPAYIFLGIAWSFVVCALGIVGMQIDRFAADKAALIPLNMIAAGVFFLLARRG